MSSFSFDAHGKTVRATLTEIKLPLGRKAYQASARCPECSKQFEAGSRIGDQRRASDIKNTLKTNVKQHVKAAHKK